jgi:hypothetical protein
MAAQHDGMPEKTPRPAHHQAALGRDADDVMCPQAATMLAVGVCTSWCASVMQLHPNLGAGCSRDVGRGCACSPPTGGHPTASRLSRIGLQPSTASCAGGAVRRDLVAGTGCAIAILELFPIGTDCSTGSII